MPHYNVLFLCTGNSARSILAEAILNGKGAPTFTAYSAGSHPSGTVRPEALRHIESAGLSTAGLRSKSWMSFPNPARLISTSSSPSAITRPKKSVPYGPASPSPRIGECPIPPPSAAPRKKSTAPTPKPSPLSIAASLCCSPCRSPRSAPSPSSSA